MHAKRLMDGLSGRFNAYPLAAANGCSQTYHAPPLVRSPRCNKNQKKKPPGSDLFSHIVADAVSSALKRFTSVFGMGTGGSASLKPPEG